MASSSAAKLPATNEINFATYRQKHAAKDNAEIITLYTQCPIKYDTSAWLKALASRQNAADESLWCETYVSSNLFIDTAGSE